MPICNRHLICDSDSQRPLELRVQDSGAASGHSVRKGQQTDSLAAGPLEIRKSPAFMLRMENEAQRKKPPTSQVYQHLGQTLDAYTDEGLTIFKTVWAVPLYLEGSLPLHLLPESPGGGTAVPQHGPSCHPCSRPALDLSSGAVNSRMRVLGHTGRAPSAGCACGLGWAQDLLLMTQYFRVQAAGLCVLQQVNYRLSKSKIK